MPSYGHVCADCGGFEASRPIAEAPPRCTTWPRRGTRREHRLKGTLLIALGLKVALDAR